MNKSLAALLTLLSPACSVASEEVELMDVSLVFYAAQEKAQDGEHRSARQLYEEGIELLRSSPHFPSFHSLIMLSQGLVRLANAQAMSKSGDVCATLTDSADALRQATTIIPVVDVEQAQQELADQKTELDAALTEHRCRHPGSHGR